MCHVTIIKLFELDLHIDASISTGLLLGWLPFADSRKCFMSCLVTLFSLLLPLLLLLFSCRDALSESDLHSGSSVSSRLLFGWSLFVDSCNGFKGFPVYQSLFHNFFFKCLMSRCALGARPSFLYNHLILTFIGIVAVCRCYIVTLHQKGFFPFPNSCRTFVCVTVCLEGVS